MDYWTMKMETLCFSKMLASINQLTWQNIPEDQFKWHDMPYAWCENLKILQVI
jgi:hypothetical protein